MRLFASGLFRPWLFRARLAFNQMPVAQYEAPSLSRYTQEAPSLTRASSLPSP